METGLILQNLGIGVASSLIAAIIIAIYNNLFNKNTYQTDNFLEQQLQYKNPVIITGFITLVLTILTIFGMYLQWKSYPYIFMGALLLGFGTKIMYEKQCPRCKRITKKFRNKEILNQEQRPYYYRDEVITYYSDGETIKDRKFVGKEKKRMENWRIEKEYYNCISCGFEWDEVFERNMDLQSRPKPTTKRVKEKPPKEEYSF